MALDWPQVKYIFFVYKFKLNLNHFLLNKFYWSNSEIVVLNLVMSLDISSILMRIYQEKNVGLN